MEAVKDVIAYIAKEWDVIGSAPVTFITALGVAGVGIWFFIKWIQSSEIAGLNQRISLSKERLEYSQERFAELDREIEKTKEAISPADSTARQHSLAASAIASDIRGDLEKTADALSLPAHLAASGAVGPVPFEGMDDTKGAKKDNENK